MKAVHFLEILKENDLAKFENFLKNMEIGEVDSKDEVEFFREAPEDWKQKYIEVSYPCPASERVLMVLGEPETLKKSYDLWGFWDENVNWIFVSGTHDVCKKVLTCMTYQPSCEAEILMLKRNSRELLSIWLEKYGSLSEDGEKLLHEESGLQHLKSIYIDEQIKKMPPL